MTFSVLLKSTLKTNLSKYFRKPNRQSNGSLIFHVFQLNWVCIFSEAVLRHFWCYVMNSGLQTVCYNIIKWWNHSFTKLLRTVLSFRPLQDPNENATIESHLGQIKRAGPNTWPTFSLFISLLQASLAVQLLVWKRS